MSANDNDDWICVSLASSLGQDPTKLEHAYHTACRNVRTVLRRHWQSSVKQRLPHEPICNFIGEADFIRTLGTTSLDCALFTLARLYDEAHNELCRALTSMNKLRPQNHVFHDGLTVDLHTLTVQLEQDSSRVQDEIVLKWKSAGAQTQVLSAEWNPIPHMSFDHLPILPSLAGCLPGEQKAGTTYAGIGGGGGSDIISASLLGRLLRRHGKEMDLLISTRTLKTGSQGGEGSSMVGVKREVFNHDGHATIAGRSVPGTYRVRAGTHTTGRDLETIPLGHHKQIWLVLDQGEETTTTTASSTPQTVKNQSHLSRQFEAVLSQTKIDTIIVLDTGGDVFGSSSSSSTTSFSTPDQDLQVQRATSILNQQYNLITAVMAPGVDAPNDAPEKALKAGAAIYKLSADEKEILLDILTREYKMDGSDPARFGKTSLALQASLKGCRGWVSLDLPSHVVDTWENPWSSFVYVRECMSDVILMPLLGLLPLIDESTI